MNAQETRILEAVLEARRPRVLGAVDPLQLARLLVEVGDIAISLQEPDPLIGLEDCLTRAAGVVVAWRLAVETELERRRAVRPSVLEYVRSHADEIIEARGGEAVRANRDLAEWVGTFLTDVRGLPGFAISSAPGTAGVTFTLPKAARLTRDEAEQVRVEWRSRTLPELRHTHELEPGSWYRLVHCAGCGRLVTRPVLQPLDSYGAWRRSAIPSWADRWTARVGDVSLRAIAVVLVRRRAWDHEHGNTGARLVVQFASEDERDAAFETWGLEAPRQDVELAYHLMHGAPVRLAPDLGAGVVAIAREATT